MSTNTINMSLIRLVSLFLLCSFFIHTSTHAQPQIVDSLKLQLQSLQEKDSNRVDVLLDLSRRTYRNDPPQARVYAFEAEEISKRNNLITRLAHSYRYLGYSFNAHTSKDSALFYLDKALELYKGKDDFRGIATVNGAKGSIYAINDEFEVAIIMMLNALDAYVELGNYLSIAIMYNNIGNIYFEQENFDKAIDYYLESINSFKKSNNPQRIVVAYIGIATVFEKMNNLEEAEKYVNLGIEIAEEYNELRSLAFLYDVAGDIDLKKNFYESARDYYNAAADLFERIRDRHKYADALQSIAELDYKLNDFNSAKINLEIILENIESERIQNFRLEEHTLESLALVEQQLGNFEVGLEYALLAKQLSDSLYEEDTAFKIAELEANYEAEKKDNEILILTYENQTTQLKMIISIIFGVAIILVISIFYWESSKRKSLQKKMEIKSIQRELEQYGILLNEKNTYLTKVVDKLNELSNDLKTMESKKSLYNLIDSLKQNISVSESEEVMFKKIEQVNTGFFIALRSHSEELSKSEKRLASLVQMDLSSKDIANILHINPKSVNQAKYRLKKKLNINPDIDLKEYLNTLATK